MCDLQTRGEYCSGVSVAGLARGVPFAGSGDRRGAGSEEKGGKSKK